MTLRPYQLAAIEAVRTTWAENSKALLCICVGGGKTKTAAAIVHDTPGRILWVAHRRELISQARQALGDDPRITVATIQSRPQGDYDLIVVDEAHHAVAASYRHLSAPLMLGLTATPHDELADLGWEVAFSYSVEDGIRDGFLVPPRYVVDRLQLDLAGVGGRWDYEPGELGAELLRQGIIEHTASRIPAGRTCLVMTATVDQARRTAEAIPGARWVAGTTDLAERAALLADLPPVLCSAALLTEGTDLPPVDAVVLARPTRSHALYTQMVGRGLRLHPGKVDCLVVDLVGASRLHTLGAPPVLLGGSRCPEAPDGLHAFAGRACTHCGRRVACASTLGPHRWQAGRCACGEVQCADSPTLEHAWIPLEGAQRRCVFCPAEAHDPLASLLRPLRRDPTVRARWVRVPGVTPHAAVCGVGEAGMLLTTWVGERHRVGWLPRGARRVRWLTEDCGPGEVRAVSDAVATRAARVADVGAGWRRGLPTPRMRALGERRGVVWRGESAGEYADAMVRARGKERLVALGVVTICHDGVTVG